MILELCDEITGISRRWETDMTDKELNRIWADEPETIDDIESTMGTMDSGGSLEPDGIWVCGGSSSEIGECDGWDDTSDKVLTWLRGHGYTFNRIDDFQYEMEDEDDEW